MSRTSDSSAEGPFAADPIVVEVVRGGHVESVHHGRVVVTDPDGAVIASVGAEFAPMYARSSLKPLQAVGMLRAGLDLEGAELAVASASHAGEDFHTDAVRAILQRSGLDPSALQSPPDLPQDEATRASWIRAGRAPEPLAGNCSGKHAAMLRTAVLGGHRTDAYRDPEHPVQRAILQTFDELAGERASELTVDGCGAPLYAFSAAGLARAYGRIAVATEGPEAAVATAIREHPEYVSGTTRDELALLRSLPGVIGKAGAEAVYAVGLPDGRGVAVKISDGSPRARSVLMAGTLDLLGQRSPELTAQASAAVLGHGERVGEIRPAAPVLAALAQQLG